jgi:glycosyltransferase involved in cell wall biosynthesis
MNETGASLIPVTKRQKEEKTFDILWVGKTDFRKQLALTIKAVATAFHDNIRLHIVGSGDMEAYLREAEKQGIADQCVIHGSVSHDEVLRIMDSADMFLFTSVAEGTPHVVLEAISMGLPVVCFDTCGQGDSVTDDIGMKIPLSHPEQSVKDFAERIEYLYKHREVLTKMSENCKQRAEELSWERKAKEMIRLYDQVKNKE